MEATVMVTDKLKKFSIKCNLKNISISESKSNFVKIDRIKNVVTILSSKKKITIAKSSEGASAYEIAIRNGTFSGTEEQFSQQQIHPEVDFLAYYILSKS